MLLPHPVSREPKVLREDPERLWIHSRGGRRLRNRLGPDGLNLPDSVEVVLNVGRELGPGRLVARLAR